MILKNVLTTLLLGVLTLSAIAQNNSTSATIRTNNVKAVINSNGAMFWDFSKGQFVTNTENADELSTMRAAGIWMGGIDPAGNLKGAIQIYNENGKADFIPGVLHPTSGEVINLNKIWHVSAAEIDAHRADFADNGVIDNPIANIYSWPARGNAFFSEYNDGMELPNTTQGLAPFWDEGLEGFYNPDNGDYPVLEVRGCFDTPIYPTEMWWFVFNDNVQHTESGLGQMNMEVQAQVFAYGCEENTPLNNTIFVRYKTLNRGLESLEDTHFGLYSDFDIGNPTDDYFGSDAPRAMVYAYNGDENDEGGYGANAPAMAMDIFRQPLNELGMELGLTYVMPVDASSLNNGLEAYNLLSGKNPDGSPAANDGFFYNGNPNNPNESSEVSEGNTPGDRQVLAASPAFRLDPGAVNELIVAYTFHQEPNQSSLENVATMYEQNNAVQAAFDNCFDVSFSGCTQTVGVEDLNLVDGLIFPNPTKNEISIQVDNYQIKEVLLLDMTGKILVQQKLDANLSNHLLNINHIDNGMYVLMAKLNDGMVFKEKLAILK